MLKPMACATLLLVSYCHCTAAQQSGLQPYSEASPYEILDGLIRNEQMQKDMQLSPARLNSIRIALDDYNQAIQNEIQIRDTKNTQSKKAWDRLTIERSKLTETQQAILRHAYYRELIYERPLTSLVTSPFFSEMINFSGDLYSRVCEAAATEDEAMQVRLEEEREQYLIAILNLFNVGPRAKLDHLVKLPLRPRPDVPTTYSGLSQSEESVFKRLLEYAIRISDFLKLTGTQLKELENEVTQMNLKIEMPPRLSDRLQARKFRRATNRQRGEKLHSRLEEILTPDQLDLLEECYFGSLKFEVYRGNFLTAAVVEYIGMQDDETQEIQKKIYSLAIDMDNRRRKFVDASLLRIYTMLSSEQQRLFEFEIGIPKAK
jgi:hypothetical protein